MSDGKAYERAIPQVYEPELTPEELQAVARAPGKEAEAVEAPVKGKED